MDTRTSVLTALAVALVVGIVVVGCSSLPSLPGNGGDLPGTDDLPDPGDVLNQIPPLPDLSPSDVPLESTSVMVTVNEAGQTEASAAAIEGASATLGGQQAESDQDGVIVFENATAATGVLLTVTADGYVDNVKRIDVVAATEVVIDVIMTPHGTTGSGTDASVMHNGGGVTIPEGGLISSTGDPVDTVRVTVVKPSDADYGAQFPGAFEGVEEGQTDSSPLRSYGIVNVDLEDASGNPVELAADGEAEVVIPIDAEVDGGSATMPLWYFDPDDSVWHEEGVLTRDDDAGVYRGPVTHFSTWNADQPYEPSYTDVKLVDQDDQPIRGGKIVIVTDGIDKTAYTEADGTTGGGAVPPNDRVTITAEKGGVKSDPIERDTPGVGVTLDEKITLPVAYLQCTVITEQGRPVGGARVTIEDDLGRSSFSTNSVGEAISAVRAETSVRIWASKFTIRSGETTLVSPALGETQQVIIRLGESLYVPTVPITFPPTLAGTWLLEGIGITEANTVTTGVSLLNLRLTITSLGVATVSTGLLANTFSGPLVITQKTETDQGTVYDMKPYSSGEQTNYVSFRLSPDGDTLWELVRDASTGATLIAAEFSRLN